MTNDYWVLPDRRQDYSDLLVARVPSGCPGEHSKSDGKKMANGSDRSRVKDTSTK